MRVLFITFSDISICSSSNIRNVSLIRGLIDNGCSVDIVSYKTSNKAMLTDESFTTILSKCRIIPLYGRAVSQQVSSNLLSMGNSGFKKNLYKTMRKVFYALEPVDSLRKVALSASIDKLDLAEYDVMISSSNPYSVHILAKRIRDRYFGGRLKWVQYWGDALYLDTLTRHPFLPTHLKRAERKLLSGCDRIVYTNAVVLDRQMELFPALAKKMTFIETPFAFFKSDNSTTSKFEYQVGYYGSYSSTVRDISPLYNVLKNSDFNSLIVGNGDIELRSHDKLKVLPRASVDKVTDYEKSTRILVCLCNKLSENGDETGLIPGKVYHYGTTEKEVLVIGATERVRMFLASYNRYIFVDNNEKDIADAIDSILRHEAIPQKPLRETQPVNAAQSFINEIINCDNRENNG